MVKTVKEGEPQNEVLRAQRRYGTEDLLVERTMPRRCTPEAGPGAFDSGRKCPSAWTGARRM